MNLYYIFRPVSRTGVDPVQVVEVRGEAKPACGDVNVFVNVGSRVGYASTPEHVKSTFGCDFVPMTS